MEAPQGSQRSPLALELGLRPPELWEGERWLLCAPSEPWWCLLWQGHESTGRRGHPKGVPVVTAQEGHSDFRFRTSPLSGWGCRASLPETE